jgi:hypothetical protein
VPFLSGNPPQNTVVLLATAHGCDIQSHDVTKAYVQGELLQREIYLIPPKELQLV